MNIPKWRGDVLHLGTKTLRILWFRVSLLALTVGVLGAALVSSDPAKRPEPSKAMVQVETASAGEALNPITEESITTREVETKIEAPSVVEDREEAKTARQNVLFHKVGNGESLWSISRRYFGHGERWKDLVEANPELKKPQALSVGMTIKIPLDSDGIPELKGR